MTPRNVMVLSPGAQTTVQDWPGRIGHLSEGFAAGGAMDDFALRVANALVGNAETAAGLEVALGGARLRFACEAWVAVCGAPAEVALGGAAVPMWTPVHAAVDDELVLGITRGPGLRTYVAFDGGLDVPIVLGARCTYLPAAIGGHLGRALTAGDRLSLGDAITPPHCFRRPDGIVPPYVREWILEIMLGPHDKGVFLSEGGVEDFLSHLWLVDRNSGRSGIRLQARRLDWARPAGGVAGGHPSNILDCGYPVGGVDMNGDTPVILGPDGPTSGGFAVVATVVSAARWKLGQIRPGTDSVQFRVVSDVEADILAHRTTELVREVVRSQS